MGCISAKEAPNKAEKSIHTVKISDLVINVSNSGSNVQIDLSRRHSIGSRVSLDGRFTNNPVIDGILEYQTYGSLKLAMLGTPQRMSNLGNESLYKTG